MCRSGQAVKMELMVSPTGKSGGSWGFSFRETSVSMLTLWLGYSLLLLNGASECYPPQESSTSGSGEAMGSGT